MRPPPKPPPVRLEARLRGIAVVLASAAVTLVAAGPAGAVPTVQSTSTTTTVPALNPRGEPPAPLTPRPFGRLDCSPTYGVRFCPGGEADGQDRRVPSFDGVPLDVDVTLPATGQGPFPLIVLLHGLGGTKHSYESTTDDGGIDNVTLADRGFAVVTYTARGFGESCGTPASRAGTPGCARGWVHLADQRYEVRDTQYLSGLLVDEGLVLPTIGVAGVSYGGGQSLELAMLRDRIRRPGGQLVPFVSPRSRIPMTVGAVYAIWPWDDLVSSLVPNGNPGVASSFATRASSAAAETAPDRQPVGIPKAAWLNVLYQVLAGAYLPPAGAVADDDITTWFHELLGGDLHSAAVRDALREMAIFHSAAGIPPSARGPSATAIQSGWTDSLFPVSEALHFDSQFAHALSNPPAPLLQIFDDVGHPWAQNKPADQATDDRLAIAFFQAVLESKGFPPTGVVAIGQTCPASAPSGPVIPAHTYGGLQQGTLSIQGQGAAAVRSASGPGLGAQMNALSRAALCQPGSDPRPAGSARYDQLVGSASVLLLGAVQITATIAVRGRSAQLIGQLWDVDPKGRRQFVTLGAFRPPPGAGPSGQPAGRRQVTFSLDPAEYTFAPGHRIEVDLVGSDSPTFRSPTGGFAVVVSNFVATLPTGLTPTVTPLTF